MSDKQTYGREPSFNERYDERYDSANDPYPNFLGSKVFRGECLHSIDSTSALTPKTDIARELGNVCQVPTSDNVSARSKTKRPPTAAASQVALYTIAEKVVRSTSLSVFGQKRVNVVNRTVANSALYFTT